MHARELQAYPRKYARAWLKIGVRQRIGAAPSPNSLPLLSLRPSTDAHLHSKSGSLSNSAVCARLLARIGACVYKFVLSSCVRVYWVEMSTLHVPVLWDPSSHMDSECSLCGRVRISAGHGCAGMHSSHSPLGRVGSFHIAPRTTHPSTKHAPSRQAVVFGAATEFLSHDASKFQVTRLVCAMTGTGS
jgi:hypothetical protein